MHNAIIGGPSIFSHSLSLPLLACEEGQVSEGKTPSNRKQKMGGEKFADSAADIDFSEKGDFPIMESISTTLRDKPSQIFHMYEGSNTEKLGRTCNRKVQ